MPLKKTKMIRKRRNVAVVKICAASLLALVVSGCAGNGESNLPPVPEVNISDVTVKDVDVESQLKPVEKLAEQDSELNFSTLEKQFSQGNRTVAAEDPTKLPAELRNRQICKNRVEVRYNVPDQNGYKNTFVAEVQVQARLKGVSPDRTSVKVEIFGWYTDNTNLRQWLPSLDSLPKYQEFSLQKGTQAWANAEGWQLCRFEDDKTSLI